VNDLSGRRIAPFGAAAAAIAVTSILVASLPAILVEQIERARVLSDAQAGWAYRLLIAAAVAQALYGGFSILRPERLEAARRRDPKTAGMSRRALIASVARNAAGMVLLTLVYGLAAFGVTGERGGFWPFVALAVAQGAWYYREVGAVARWLGFQPEPVEEQAGAHVWRREPHDYCPPLVRGLSAAPNADPPR